MVSTEYNTIIMEPDEPDRPGYNFNGWFKEADCIHAWDFINDKVIEDITLYAKWLMNRGSGSEEDDSSGGSSRGSSAAPAVTPSTDHFSVYGAGYTAPSEKFTDIATHWAKGSIDYVVGRGLFSGTAETKFSPDAAMSRGMLVTVLGRLSGVDVSGYKTSSFTDVKAGSYFLPYVEWAYQKGIISGVGGDQFVPDRNVTREEVAVILKNYAKATGYTLPVTRTPVTFADNSSIGSYARDAVKAMQQAGIMIGEQNNAFHPKANATRGSVAATLQRYIDLTIDPAAR